MPDNELNQALKLAKTRNMFFVFIPKAPDGKLIVSKTKIPPSDILEAKKAISGGTPVTGTISGNLDDMYFKVGKPTSGSFPNYVMKIAKREAGLNIVVTVVTGMELVEDATKLDEADAKIPPPLPIPQIWVNPGDELAKMITLGEVLESITPIKGDFPDGAHFNLTMAGKKYEINQKEADTNRKNAKTAFANAVRIIKQMASSAQDQYKDYRKTMKTGWFGTAATFVFDHVSVTDPGDAIERLVQKSNKATDSAMAASNNNSFVSAANSLIEADIAAERADKMMWKYKDGLEGSAATTVTGLKAVKTASEITLAVGGAVVTGGGTVAFAGGLGITAAGDLAPALLGEKVDWKHFAFDMALGVVMKKVLPSDAMESAILDKLGTKVIEKVGEKAAKEAFAKVMTISLKAMMKKSAEAAEKKLRGKDVSWDDYTEATRNELYKQTTIEVAKLLLKG